MNNYEQRIAIAEACGWRRDTTTDAEFSKSRIRHIWVSPEGKRFIHGISGPPDYLSDLNAMHEAEKTLRYENQPRYIIAIRKVMMSYAGVSDWDTAHATASVRAEAFLRTLDLWKPQP